MNSQKLKVIYKYPLKITEAQQLELPISCTILSAQMQNGELCLWGIVEPDEEKKMFTVKICGTGQEFDCNNQQYIGTVQDRSFVWHIFIKQ